MCQVVVFELGMICAVCAVLLVCAGMLSNSTTCGTSVVSVGAFFGFVIEFEAFLALFDHNLFLEIDRLRVGVDHVQRLNQLVNFGRHA